MNEQHDPTTQYVRCYTEAEHTQQNTQPYTTRRVHTLMPEAEAIQRIGAPYDGWCVVFDTETTTDPSQTLRFGTYAVYGLDRDERMRRYRAGCLTRAALDTLHDAGIFYNADLLTTAEIDTISDYAKANGLACMPVEIFIKQVLYKWAYNYRALVIGHNLAFDLSRLAVAWGAAAKDFRGGFWLRLCRCQLPNGRNDCCNHPNIRTKHLGRYKDRIAFSGVSTPKGRKKGYKGRFLDTATFAKAIAGMHDTRLAALCEKLGVAAEQTKLDVPEHGVTITSAYVDYACRDVAATWAVYQKLRDLYKQHGLSTEPWNIFSEASIAKAYLKEFGVPSFMQQNPDFHKDVLVLQPHFYVAPTFEGQLSAVCRTATIRCQMPSLHHRW